MAVVSTRKKDTRYEHLQKVYSEVPGEEFGSQFSSTQNEANSKTVEKKVTVSKSEIVTFALMFSICMLLGISGYLAFRFI